MAKVQMSKPTQILPARLDNRLKEFEELLLDNILLKVQNQALGDRNPSGKNGGKQSKSSQRTKSRKTWGWLKLMNKFINWNYKPTELFSQISSINNFFSIYGDWN